MQVSEYKNTFSQEESHFIHVGTHNSVIQILNKYLPKRRNNKILDAGCGTGLLVRRLGSFGQVWGIDISEEAFKFSRLRGIKNLKKSSVTQIPFPDNYFDVIVSIDVLYHQKVEDDLKALREFNRVLKPKGLAIIKVPAYNWLRGHHDIVMQTRRRYTTNDLSSKLKKSGFLVKKVSYINTLILLPAIFKRLIDMTFGGRQVTSDIYPLPSFLNNLLIQVQKIETKIMILANLPWGLSVFSIVQKRAELKIKEK